MSWVEVAIVAPLAIWMATFVLRHDSTDAELGRLRVSRERHKRANEMHQAEVSDLTDAIEDALDSLEEARREATHGATASGQYIDRMVDQAITRLRQVTS